MEGGFVSQIMFQGRAAASSVTQRGRSAAQRVAATPDLHLRPTPMMESRSAGQYDRLVRTLQSEYAMFRLQGNSPKNPLRKRTSGL